MSERRWNAPLVPGRRCARTLVLGLLAVMCAQGAPGLIDWKTGHLVAGETDLALPAGGVLLELRRVATSGEEGGGVLGRPWRLSVEKRVAASARETIREVEAGREIYRPDGKLARIEMQNRGTVTLSYDAAGRLTGLRGPAGAAIRFTLNAAGRMIRAESTEGVVAEYRYLNGSLSEVRVRGRAPQRYFYDALRRITRIEDAGTGAVTISYDAKNRVLLRSFPQGTSEAVAYNDARREMRITDAAGGVTTTVRSADGLTETTTDPAGRRTEVRFDAQGRPVQVTVGGREPILTTYDRLGRIVSTGAAGKALRYEYAGDSPLVSAITFPGGGRHVYAYDANGQLLSIREGEETMLAVSYMANGLPASMRRRGEPEMRYSYRPDGRLASESDSTGRQWQYEYDARGNLIRERLNGHLTSYEYDAQDRLIAAIDPAGALTRYPLDCAGRQTRITDALGGVRQFEYDAAGRLASETDAAGRSTRYRYDAVGRVVGVTHPGGAERSFAYGPAGNLLRAVNPVGGVTRYDYGPAGDLLRVTDPAGQTWAYQYSGPGQVSTVVGPDGRATEILYDEQRRRAGWRDDAGTQVRFERDAQGRLVGIRLPGGMVHRVTYDQAGRPVSEEASLASKVERQFDDAGRLTLSRNSTGAYTSYRYDASGALAEMKESGGAVLSYEYDGRGLRTTARDAQGRLARFSYDLLGRLTQVTGPGAGSRRLGYGAGGDLERVQEANGDTVQLSYNGAGQLSRVVHPSGIASEFERDAFGNPTRAVFAGIETRYTYDAAGRLLSEIDSSGGTKSYRYDAAGQISEMRLPDGRQVKYQYDRGGRRIGIDDGVFPVRFAYDPAGRRSRIEYPAIRAALGYEYDASGRLAKMRAPDGREIGYSYDAHQRLTAIVLPGGKELRMSYDPAGRLSELVYPNGVRGVWKRDAAGRLLEISYTGAGGKTLDGSRYEYDAAGHVTRVSRADGAVTEYSYDASGQILEERTSKSAVRYSYLPGGDRASRDADGRSTAYRYNNAGQLSAAGPETLTCDARGNLVTRGNAAGATSYRWDSAGRLERVVLADRSEIRYGYSGAQERVWREEGKRRTWFVTDGINLIADLDSSFNVEALYVHAPGVDRPLAVLTPRGAQFYHSNALGSITSLTDEAGQVAATYGYDAFGTVVEMKGSASRFLHAAREYDAAIGLYYVRARYYDPRLGRFISADPQWADWSDPLALNRYAYVRNAPTRYIDRSGASLTDAEVQGAWDLSPEQWNHIKKRVMEVGRYSRPQLGQDLAELTVASQGVEPTGETFEWGSERYPKSRTVKGQELYDKVVSQLDRQEQQRAQIENEALRAHREAEARKLAAALEPQPARPAEAPPEVNSAGQPQPSSNAPADPTPEERAGAARGTVRQPAPEPAVENSRPIDSPELHTPTVRSPVGGGAGPVASAGPRGATFGPQSRIPTLEVEAGTIGSLGVGALGTALSVAADVEEGKDLGQSLKDNTVGGAAAGLMIGVPAAYIASGTGVLAGAAAASGPLLAAGAVAYGGYRYASAVANRPERQAEARRQQQLEVNAGLAGQILPELRDVATRELGEIESLRSRYSAASASILANASGIRERVARIQGALSSLRAAAQSGGTRIGDEGQFKEWESSLEAKVREANSLADGCASEADAANAVAAYNDAVGRAAYIVKHAEAARAAAATGSGDIAGLRDRIVADTEAVVAMQSRLASDWDSLPTIRAQAAAKRQALMERIDRVRANLPPDLTPPQRRLFEDLALNAKDARFGERPGSESESPQAMQSLAGTAVEAKLEAQSLASRAGTPAAPEAAEGSAGYAIVLLAGAEAVPSKAQTCRDRLASAAEGFVSLGGETKAENDDTKPQQKEAAAGTPESVNLLNTTPSGQPQPETEFLTRNSVRQAMEGAQAQSERRKQEQQLEYERQMQELQQKEQQAAAQPPRAERILAALNGMVQGYNAMQAGINSPAGFQNPQVAQYYANMMETLRQQNGGQGPSNDQLSSLLSTIQRLQAQAASGQSVSQQQQPRVSSLAQVMGEQPRQPSLYEQQARQLGQVMGARSGQAVAPGSSRQPQQGQPSQPGQPSQQSQQPSQPSRQPARRVDPKVTDADRQALIQAINAAWPNWSAAWKRTGGYYNLNANMAADELKAKVSWADYKSELDAVWALFRCWDRCLLAVEGVTECKNRCRETAYPSSGQTGFGLR